MVDPSVARSPSLSLQLTTETSRTVRDLENDQMVAAIAKRMAASEHRGRERRHTHTYLRRLRFPVYAQEGVLCTCAVVEHFVLKNPREHEMQTHFFATLQDALQAFPKVRVTPDVESVQPNLRAVRVGGEA